MKYLEQKYLSYIEYESEVKYPVYKKEGTLGPNDTPIDAWVLMGEIGLIG